MASGKLFQTEGPLWAEKGTCAPIDYSQPPEALSFPFPRMHRKLCSEPLHPVANHQVLFLPDTTRHSSTSQRASSRASSGPGCWEVWPRMRRVLEAALRSWDELKARRVGADSRKLSLEAMAPVAPTPCRKPTLPDHSPTPHQAHMQDPHPRPLRGAGCDSRAPRHPLPNAILPVARNPPHPFFLPQGPPSGGMFA